MESIAHNDTVTEAGLQSRKAEALAAYCRAKKEAHERKLTGDETRQYLQPFANSWQRLWEVDVRHSTPTSDISSASSSDVSSATSSQGGGQQSQVQVHVNINDLSSPLNKPCESWFKRAFRWPAGRHPVVR